MTLVRNLYNFVMRLVKIMMGIMWMVDMEVSFRNLKIENKKKN
jgi:hypothetical protein